MRFPVKKTSFSHHGGKLKLSPLQPVLPLLPEVLPTKGQDKLKFINFKLKFINFELKFCAGQPAGSTTYKKLVRVFEEGSPQQWINLIQDLEEIWKQNSINGPSDRTSTIRALLKGKSLTAFETALEDIQVDLDPNVNALHHRAHWTHHGSGFECLPSSRAGNPEALDGPRHEKAIQPIDLKNCCGDFKDQQLPSRLSTWIASIQIHRSRGGGSP
jgi:hypothetical protein